MELKKEGIVIKPLKQITLEAGDVYHVLKSSEAEFNGFKEAYFSQIKKNKIKAWKRHLKMTMNLVIPIGKFNLIFMMKIEILKT